MAVEGMASRGNEKWSFTVQDASLVQRVQEAQRQGQTVNVEYEQKFWVTPWNGDTKYIVKSVAPVPSPGGFQY